MAELGLYGLAVMGQNFALNVAEKGFKISVCNRSPSKVDDCVRRAKEELGDKADNLKGYKEIEDFISSLAKPRNIFLLVAHKAVDKAIETFVELLDEGDQIIDGGNTEYIDTIRRGESVSARNLLYSAIGVSGGETGARNGPSLMPGGPREGYDRIKHILEAVAAKSDSGTCVSYMGPQGAGNLVKTTHNGIEYADMESIAEVYTILKTIGGLDNDELSKVFVEWNKGELDSYLIEITSKILAKRDVDVFKVENGERLEPKESQHLMDQILDRTGSKGTGAMTVRDAALRGVPVGGISAALDARFIAADIDARKELSSELDGPTQLPEVDREQLIDDVRNALFCAKVVSYAQGMNLIKATSDAYEWGVDLSECARIWTGGCIIRARLLARIKAAYDRNPQLTNLLVDPEFKEEMAQKQKSWRRIVSLCAAAGIPIPGMYASLAYFDQYRRATLIGASLIQGQRDFFGSHTFERKDQPRGVAFHCKWTDEHYEA